MRIGIKTRKPFERAPARCNILSMSKYPDQINALIDEIRTTKMSPIQGHPGCKKIYKMVLLLAMLESDGRNASNWWRTVTPKQIAEFFHHILTHHDVIRNIQFSDKDKADYQFELNVNSRRFTENLIRTNPMHFWGNRHTFGRYDQECDSFCFNIEIPPAYQSAIFEEVKVIALTRIHASMPGISLPYDFYDFSAKGIEREMVSEITALANYDVTDREALVKTRIGQGKFRTLLIERYSHCLLCRLTHPKLLTASHIKRWSESENNERLDLDNALLLCPVHDRLFDKWFISFDTDGKCLINNEFRKHPDLKLIGIPQNPLRPLNEQNQFYLEFHRKKFYGEKIS